MILTNFDAADFKFDSRLLHRAQFFYLGHAGVMPLPIVVGLVLTFVGTDNNFRNHDFSHPSNIY